MFDYFRNVCYSSILQQQELEGWIELAYQSAMKVIAAIGDDEYLEKIAHNIASFEDVSMVASSKYATDIVKLCEQLSPDILISDLSLEHGRMNHVIEKICGKSSNKIKVITTATSKEGEAYMPQAIQNGAQLFMQNLDNPHVLYDTLHMVRNHDAGQNANKPSKTELSRLISELFHKLKLPAHFTGYHYLKSAILHTTLRDAKLPDISSRLYLKIAEEFDTNMRHVERAIARAVTHMNNACGKEYILRTILGYEVDASNYTLSVKELIALVSDQLRIQYFTD